VSTSRPPEDSPQFLAHCQASATGNPMLEQIRDRGADTVLAIYRLVKNALVHAIDNRAVTQAAAQSRQILADFAALVGNTASVTFLGDTIFVCGQLLRASRMVYDSAIELGGIFARSGISEVAFESAVTAEELLAFVGAVVVSQRDPDRRAALLESKIPHIVVRKVDAELQQREDEEELGQRERIVQFYATALVVMRGFFDQVARGATILPHRVKRLSQQLVGLTQSSDPALIGLTAMANAQRDDAGRAVLAAIVAVVLGRQITNEKLPLARLAMAALMGDAGRARLVGPEGRDVLLALPEDLDARVPAATSSVCIATGGVNVPNALRTVVTNEVTWLEREKLVGPLYQKQRAPLVESQVLRLARAVIDELAPRDVAIAPKSPLDALDAVAALPGMDTMLLRLLINAVGLLPTGSVVEFETGEWGVVVGPSRSPDAFDRPVVRLVTDRSGRPLQPPREVDLGAGSSAGRFPKIANVVPPKKARFNVTGVFVA